MKMPQFVWEFFVCILWLTMFGIFGKMFIGFYPASESGFSRRDESSSSSSSLSLSANAGADASPHGAVVSSATAGLGGAAMINRMRHAVWVDLVNLALWVVTASWILLRYLKGRGAAGATSAAEKV